MKKIIIFSLVLLFLDHGYAQIGIGTATVDPSAMLHVQATDKGMLIPRMTEAQRIAIVSPAQGLLVYQTNNAEGVWSFTAGQWKNLSASNNGGKYMLILSDGITNAEAAARIAAEVGPNTQVVRIERCTNLTTVDLSMITTLTEIYVYNNTSLQSLNFTNLQSVDYSFVVNGCPALSSMPLANLQKVGADRSQFYEDRIGLQIAGTAISSFNFSSLTTILGNISIIVNTSLTSLSFPLLTTASGWFHSIGSNSLLSSISIPLLTSIPGDLFISGTSNLSSFNMPSLTTVGSELLMEGLDGSLATLSLPALKNAQNLNIINNPTITTVSLPQFLGVSTSSTWFVIQNNSLLTSIAIPALTSVNADAIMSGNKLPSAQVNALLNKFVSITPLITNKTFDLRQSVAAPPTGQGITDKATLIARPNTVLTD